MAKDDYFVIVYKILSYLYVQLKAGENLIKDGYITCDSMKAWGKESFYDLKTAEITPAGMAYACF